MESLAGSKSLSFLLRRTSIESEDRLSSVRSIAGDGASKNSAPEYRNGEAAGRRRSQSGIYDPGAGEGVRKASANFEQLVLGCIDADVCK